MRKVLFLTSLSRWSEQSLLLVRLLVGAFLVWGVSDNLFNSSQMKEFESFLQNYGFFKPSLMALVSVWVQFAVGVSFVLGIFIRWAGLLCSVNFIIAIIMVDSDSGIRASFPSACLVVIGIYLATHGAGRFSLDRKLFNS
ncbi:MAG: DoxX family protein [Kangiellaceae bacterium]|nr:DoxX family protein [Kangiellaceae bacterium]MCW9016257.1 DoxX family protein [Kangiellaceae bacterium]